MRDWGCRQPQQKATRILAWLICIDLLDADWEPFG